MSRRKKLGVRIWVHVLALVLMVSMVMGVGTIEAQAAMMENIVVSNIQYGIVKKSAVDKPTNS